MRGLDQFSQVDEKQSVGAAVLGFVGDRLPFVKSKETEQEKIESSQYREFLAEAVADTAAIIPRYGPITGGIVRAALLIRPGDSLSGNVKSFGGNFAEGVALKKISQLALPEGYLATKYNKSSAQLVQGFAFGAVKAGFNENSWYRDDGSFSVKEGTFKMASAGIFAGAVNIPLSFLAGKLTGAVVEATSSTGLGAKSSLVMASLASGYGTGFLLGSSNALLEGKTGGSLLAAGNDAGMLSALTGGVLAASSPIRFAAIEHPAARDLSRMVAFQSKGRNQEAETSNHEFKVPMLHPDQLRALSRERATVADRDLLSRSENYSLVTQAQRVSKEDVPLGSVPLFSERFYLNRLTNTENWLLRRYDLDHKQMGPLYVKHEYANELDARLAGAIKSSSTKVSSELSPPHHTEIQQAFVQTPDPSLIRRIDVRPDKNIYTLWHRRLNRDPFMEILATAKASTGEIIMNVKSRANVTNTADHEWSHLLEPKAPKERALFEVAAALERKGYYVSDYAKKNSSENWAEHGAAFLGPKFGFLDFVHGAPLRAVSLTRGMARATSNAENLHPVATDKGLSNRIQYVQENVLPGALKNLESRMLSRDQVEASRAALMYGAIAEEQQLNLLHSHVLNNKFLRAAAYSALVARMHNDQYQPRGYENALNSSKQSELDKFLTYHLRPTNRSYSRNFAFEGILNQSAGSSLSPLIGSEQKELKRFFGDALYLVVH